MASQGFFRRLLDTDVFESYSKLRGLKAVIPIGCIFFRGIFPFFIRLGFRLDIFCIFHDFKGLCGFFFFRDVRSV